MDDTRFDTVRKKINATDEKILELLNSRAKLSMEVGRIKAGSGTNVFRPFREKDLLQSLVEKNPGPLPAEHLVNIYTEILSSSRRLQRPQSVAYLGPEGTFSYLAGVEFLGKSSEFVPMNSLRDVFAAVSENRTHLGVIPLENSLQGSVGQSLDLFLSFELTILAELFCRISHSLLGRSSGLKEVERVYSHPQALQQCANWLRSNLPEAKLVPVSSTAAAAQEAEKDEHGAAIGHFKLASQNDLEIIHSGIEDLPDNWTRFLILGREPTEDQGNRDKTSILFTLPDKPGSLVRALQVLSGRGINMTKLESRPLPFEKWKYVFFADVQCDLTAGEYKKMLEELNSACHSMRVLGSYPEGKQVRF
ncbi:MAG: prephenate dehydratase [Desulfonatronovibrionaceae bacterium]